MPCRAILFILWAINVATTLCGGWHLQAAERQVKLEEQRRQLEEKKRLELERLAQERARVSACVHAGLLWWW